MQHGQHQWCHARLPLPLLLRRFPPDGARKYALVFWDHGSGWMGFGADATCGTIGAGYSENYCGIGSMQTVITGVANALTGVTDPVTHAPFKLDVVGFDACLMAMYEVGSLLAPYANYLLASELLEPGTGWDYSQLGYLTLGTLGQGGLAVNTATGFSEAQLAQLVIQGYLVRRGCAALAGGCVVPAVGAKPPGAMASIKPGTQLPCLHSLIVKASINGPRPFLAVPNPAQASTASGLTMALVDLRLVAVSLVPAMSALATELKQQLQATPGV